MFAALGDFAHGLDADLEMQIRVLAEDSLGGFPRLDPVAPEGKVRNEQQCADWNFACESTHEQRRRLHFDSQGALFVELSLELVVKFPKPVIGSVNHPGPVIESFL